VILHVDLAQGERITDDPEEGTLLWLAPDVNQIEAELEINEKDIGQVQKGQKVYMLVETYPNRPFESTIHHISFIAKTEKEEECVYQAKAYLDNPRLLLRPGMSVQATIDVDSTDSALTLTSHAFLVKYEHLQPIAQLLEYTIQPIEKQSKQTLLQEHADQNIQFVWRVNDHSFQEIPVEIGMTDNLYFEVKAGLNGDEQLVADVMAQDDMQKIYETLFRKL
jgi:HlyD family secretion protein